MADQHQMGEFWDARAREDALFFVDDRMRYGDPHEERFWAGGPEALDDITGALGVAVAPDDAVVEVGCGIGRITRALSARAASVVAVDVSAEMLAQAQDRSRGLANVTWLQNNGTDLAGLEDASADVCFSHVVFQHIPDPEVTLGYVREMGRVLRPGGWAAFQVSNAPQVHRRGGVLRRALGRAPKATSDPRWLGSAVDLDALRTAATEGGLELERVLHPGTQFCLILARRGGE